MTTDASQKMKCFVRKVGSSLHFEPLLGEVGLGLLDLTLEPTQSFQIDMSQLAAGTYILKIWVGDENFSTRLIKN